MTAPALAPVGDPAVGLVRPAVQDDAAFAGVLADATAAPPSPGPGGEPVALPDDDAPAAPVLPDGAALLAAQAQLLVLPQPAPSPADVPAAPEQRGVTAAGAVTLASPAPGAAQVVSTSGAAGAAADVPGPAAAAAAPTTAAVGTDAPAAGQPTAAASEGAADAPAAAPGAALTAAPAAALTTAPTAAPAAAQDVPDARTATPNGSALRSTAAAQAAPADQPHVDETPAAPVERAASTPTGPVTGGALPLRPEAPDAPGALDVERARVEQVTAPSATTPSAAPAHPLARTAVERAPAQVQPAVAELARGLRDVGGGRASLVVRLDPPELGPVVVRLTVRDGRVDVQLRTSEAVASVGLADARPAVRTTLAEHGLDLSSFDVAQGDTSGAPSERRASSDQATPERRPRADQRASATGARGTDALLDPTPDRTAGTAGAWL